MEGNRFFISKRNASYPTIEDLRNIVAYKWTRPKDGYNEVYPGIFIGDALTALSLGTLRANSISHVLNSAAPCSSCLRKENCGTCVMTKEAFYKPHIKLLLLATIDERRFPLWRYFEEAADFIEDCLESGGIEGFYAKNNKKTASDINILKSLGITYIINGALGKDPKRYVHSSLKYYHKRNLFIKKYLGIKAMDIMNFQLHPFFPKSSEMIEEALNSNGKVLIHCREGISRSATLVLAFLMMKRNMSSREAIELVRQKREIYPNDGFLEQLIDLDIRLKTRQ